MTPTSDIKRKRLKSTKAILWTILGAASVFVLMSFLSDLDDLGRALRDFPIEILALACLLSLGNYWLRYLKWHWYLARMHQKIKWFSNLLVFLSAFALTVTPGKLGEFIKAFILKQKHQVPYTASTAALLMERFTDVVALLLLGSLGLFLEFLHPVVAVIPVLVIIISILLLRNRNNAAWIIRTTGRYKRLRKFSRNFAKFYTMGWPLLKLDILSGAIIISLAAWIMEGVEYVLVARALGFHISLMEGIFIYSAALLAGALTLFLGGLGATEGGLVALGVAFGMTRTVSVASAIVVRLTTLWFAVLIGWVVVVLTPGFLSLLRISDAEDGIE